VAVTLQAEGATLVATVNPVSPVIPTHQADDIIVVCAVIWVPVTSGDAAQIPTPTNYTLLGAQVGQPAGTRDGWSAVFWRRVTGGGTTVTVERGAGWDTGTDTCFGARAYVIRGCITTGNPFDASAESGPHTAANQAFPAVTVSGADRLVIQFGNSMDNQTFAMTSTGWTTGTGDSDPGGTDCNFQTARKTTSSNTTADTATVSAPAQGAYAFHGVSFAPQPTNQTLTAGAPVVTLSAPAATRIAQTTLAAGAPVLNFSAPAASFGGGAQTLQAGAPVLTFSAPAAIRIASAILAAGAALLNFSAPSATLVPGGTILSASAPVLTFSAPTASVYAGGDETPEAPESYWLGDDEDKGDMSDFETGYNRLTGGTSLRATLSYYFNQDDMDG